jgi:hypothetical protein
MNHRLIAAGLNDAGLEVVRDGDLGHVLEKRAGAAVSRDSGGQLFVGKRLSKGLVAGPRTATNRCASECFPEAM